MSLDAIFIALGALASLAVTALKRFVPPFARWFDNLSDENRQALLLWIGVAIVAAKYAYDVATGAIPFTLESLIAYAGNLLLMWGGTGGVFTATRYAGRSRNTPVEPIKLTKLN